MIELMIAYSVEDPALSFVTVPASPVEDPGVLNIQQHDNISEANRARWVAPAARSIQMEKAIASETLTGNIDSKALSARDCRHRPCPSGGSAVLVVDGGIART